MNTLFAFGVNHEAAPLEIRERLHLSADEIPAFLATTKDHLSECLVLSTCNRTEIYAVCDADDLDINVCRNLLIDFKGAANLVNEDHFFTALSCGAAEHLFSVATGSRSKIIGDSQILGQLRRAYLAAQEAGSIGKILHQLVQRALKVGKQTYTDTCLHKGAVSASLAAVQMAIKNFGTLSGRTAMIIGAGEAARCSAEALAKRGLGKLLVTNRTRAHADGLAQDLSRSFALPCEVVDFTKFKTRLSETDIVVSSTCSNIPILYKEDFAKCCQPMLVIDIAVPRDVDLSAAQHAGLTLRNIDDLDAIIDQNHQKRLNDLPVARRIVAAEKEEFLSWYYCLALMPDNSKSGTKPTHEHTSEILKAKSVLVQNMSEIHALTNEHIGNFDSALKTHRAIITKLKALRAAKQALIEA